MATRKELEERLAFRKAALEQARKAYLALLTGGVKSYAMGSKNLTKLDLPQLEDSITKWEKEIAALEDQLGGNSGFGSRRAMGVVPRDW